MSKDPLLTLVDYKVNIDKIPKYKHVPKIDPYVTKQNLSQKP